MKDKDTAAGRLFPESITGACGRWELPLPVDAAQVIKLSEELGISEEISSLLLRRAGGLVEPAKNLWSGHHPFPEVMALPGIKDGVARIIHAVESQEHVLIYSDFDADGVTSAVILNDALASAGVRNVSVFFPCRFEDGYGFHSDRIDDFAKQGIGLIITADCGITGEEACSRARELGIDVVVTDHHKIGPRLPKALSIINPQLPAWQSLGLQDLTGAGVAYLLARGLLEAKGLLDKLEHNWAKDMLALSIAGDGQPVTGLNRVWIKQGLRLLSETNRPGIMALLLVSGVFRLRAGEYSELASTVSLAVQHNMMAEHTGSNPVEVALGQVPGVCEIRECLELRDIEFERDVMFGLVPRLNAAGRMGSANDAFDLLCETSLAKAFQLAVKLDKLNQQRRKIEEGMLDECFSDIELSRPQVFVHGDDLDHDFCLNSGQVQGTGSSGQTSYPKYSVFAHRPSWHEGVVGIAASRVRDTYGRPCALAGGEGSALKGSVRGIPGFNVHEALSRCHEFLLGFGGHEGAGGFSVTESNIPGFAGKFEEVCQQLLEDTALEQAIQLDDVFSPSDLQQEFLKSCLSLEPFGRENPAPLFGVIGCKIAGARLLGKSRNHLELVVDGKEPLRFIWFRAGEKAGEVCFPGACDIVFTPSRNVYMGRESISLFVRDIRPAWSLFGRGYHELASGIPEQGPAIIYTWSRDAASSMYVALMREGLQAALHFRGQERALVHDARMMIRRGSGVVISTAPWDLAGGHGMPPVNLIVAHLPVSIDSLKRISQMAQLPNVNLDYMDNYAEDAKVWLESRFPSKEYMEKVWKSLAGRPGNNGIPVWEIGPLYSGGFQDLENRTYDQNLLLLRSCISIMIELGMISYDIAGRTPRFVLRKPNGQVSLLGSALYSQGRQAEETARRTWKIYEGGTRYGGEH